MRSLLGWRRGSAGEGLPKGEVALEKSKVSLERPTFLSAALAARLENMATGRLQRGAWSMGLEAGVRGKLEMGGTWWAKRRLARGGLAKNPR